MKTHQFTIFLTIAALLSACAAQPTATPAPSTNTPLPSPSETSTQTAITRPTLTQTPTPTSNPAMVTAGSEAVNCRFGPGAQYAAVGGLAAGSSAAILGKTFNADFWQIENPNHPEENCWVAASVTNASGDTANVPTVAAPQAQVTNVSMSTPDTIETTTCSDTISPMDLLGTIEVNGPLTVIYHFETQQGGALDDHKSTFPNAGSYQVEDTSYTPPLVENTYWVKLVVTDPITWEGKATYMILCE